MRFILVPRRTSYGTEMVWINVDHIDTISIDHKNEGSRIAMRDILLYCEDDVGVVLEKIRRAEDDP